MSEIKSELQTYTPVRGMLICQNGTGDYVSKTEERHIKELQAVKDKAIKAYISTCTKNEMGCVA